MKAQLMIQGKLSFFFFPMFISFKLPSIVGQKIDNHDRLFHHFEFFTVTIGTCLLKDIIGNIVILLSSRYESYDPVSPKFLEVGKVMLILLD